MKAELRSSGSWASGLATMAEDGAVLDTWFPHPRLTDALDAGGTIRLSAEEAAKELGQAAVACLGKDRRRGVDIIAVRTAIASLRLPPIDPHDVYLRLHLLSHRLIRPHEANLEGMFGLLVNVAWTSIGPCPLDQVDDVRIAVRAAGGSLAVGSIDKIPRMTDYVSPPGVRIADADRVRLGAHLAAGTTVLHAGSCNFNAGTLGVAMVEGRISAGVVVGDGSHIGGGASTMGTGSASGTEIITIGERCLLGANSGIGISLGDDCVVEAGCYVTAGSRVSLPDGSIVKAAELSGRASLLFRRNSLTGAIEAIPRAGSWGGLDPLLHIAP